MNSFNHYAYGAIGDWMYRVSAGIEAKKPGYKEIIFQPHLTKKLNYSKATFESAYGTISSAWERKEGKIIVSVTIPANTKSTIVLPFSEESKVTESGRALKENPNFSNIRISNNNVMIEAGSGKYIFEFTE
jgi:alpha-L-rhamnosidase